MAGAAVSVLLVDDNQVFRTLALRFLQMLPEVKHIEDAPTGAAGLLRMQEQQPDIVLVDLDMRDEHGLKLIPKIRAEFPQVAIIALSLLDAGAFASRTVAAGADAFVDKMTMNVDLAPVMQSVCQRLGA